MNNYRFPKKNDKAFISFLEDHEKTLNDVKKVKVVSKPNTEELECHKNVNSYIEKFGGEKIVGCYVLINSADDSLYLRWQYSFYPNQ